MAWISNSYAILVIFDWFTSIKSHCLKRLFEFLEEHLYQSDDKQEAHTTCGESNHHLGRCSTHVNSVRIVTSVSASKNGQDRQHFAPICLRDLNRSHFVKLRPSRWLSGREWSENEFLHIACYVVSWKVIRYWNSSKYLRQLRSDKK